MVTKRLFLGDVDEALLLCGEQDSNLRAVEKKWGVQIFARAQALAVRGNAKRVDMAIEMLEEMRRQIQHGTPSAPSAVPQKAATPPLVGDEIFVNASGRTIRTLSEKQKKYLEAINSHDMVLSVGPAGTGKTFLAVVAAVQALHCGKVSRIVLTRPVVEAGEKLGFLPGDFYDKVNPYLKPLYDGFLNLLGPDRFRTYREDEIIEIAPLAYMRGRTLDQAFVILDEAQNTTPEQMKMFLTRMGAHSKVVITGDVTQVDLDFKQRSGFVESLKILRNVPEVAIVELEEIDIVRHPLVKKILGAYRIYEADKNK